MYVVMNQARQLLQKSGEWLPFSHPGSEETAARFDNLEAVASAETGEAEALEVIRMNIVTFDETRFFTIAREDAPLIKRIYSVYAYDALRATNACELTPSYDLRYLYSDVELVDAMYDDGNDEKRQELWERYALDSSFEDKLVHCLDIAKIATDEKRHKFYGDVIADDGYENSFDSVCEKLRGNPPF